MKQNVKPLSWGGRKVKVHGIFAYTTTFCSRNAVDWDKTDEKVSCAICKKLIKIHKLLVGGTAAGNDDKELEKRCEIAVKEVVEDSRRRSYEKRRAKSSKKAGKGRGKEKGAGSSPSHTSLGSAPSRRGDG